MQPSESWARPSAASSSSSGVYRFDDFELDLCSRELRKRGVRLKISPQTFRLLSYLLENRDTTVTREQLCHFLWPSHTYLEFEGNLNAAVRDVREALGDSARSPRYIRTEPRLGYSFVRPIKETGFNALVEPRLLTVPALGVGTKERRPVREKVLWFSAGGLAVALSILAAYLLADQFGAKVTRKFAGPTIRELSNFTGHIGHATFSPDGQRIAFDWNGWGNGQSSIFVRSLEHLELARLSRDDGEAIEPAWSPDGQNIAFVKKNSSGQMEIRVVPATGGAERSIVALPNESKLTWSADGRWIGYAVSYLDDSVTPLANCGIWIVSAINGERRQLTRLNTQSLGDLSPSLSPDGRWLAFFRSFSSGIQDIFLLPLNPDLHAAGGPQRLTSERQNARDLTWTPDSQAIIFSSRRKGNSSLWRVSIHGGGSDVAPLGGEDAVQPIVNPRTNDVVYTRMTFTDRLRRVPLDSTGNRSSDHAEFLYPLKQARNPSLTPDSQSVTFEFSNSGRIEPWTMRLDGAGLHRLVALPSPLTGSPRWSPDGSQFAFDSRIDGRSRIYIANADGRSVRALTDGVSEDILPSWSANGKYVYYTSDRGGSYQICRVTRDGLKSNQVTLHGGFRALESPDGKALFYAKGGSNSSLWQLSLNAEGEPGGEERRIIDSLSYWPNFAIGMRNIWFVPSEVQAGITIMSLDRATGARRALPPLAGQSLHGMAVSRDASFLLLSVRESIESNLMLMTFHP